MASSLTAVQFDMLFLANKNMIRYKRTWYNYPRNSEIEWLKGWFRRTIGLSWLDDNRGILKKNGWVRRWQTGKRKEGGIFRGSEGRGQFTWRTVCALQSRGILVLREVYALAKKSTASRPEQPPSGAARPTEKDAHQLYLKENPFTDRSFRKKKGFKPDPPLGPESK